MQVFLSDLYEWGDKEKNPHQITLCREFFLYAGLVLKSLF
ncbi:hypothetical protein B4098_1772 [Heyndrickxia coagulans]|uniref:Uncharacterized protein n=1 Tax=Heyndrickxia coagulans TaxID=1398 RepID=A0A150K4T3_HEYCO|nr:hypothetical protein B4098_1772 [Heyndrickxia coagulans]